MPRFAINILAGVLSLAPASVRAQPAPASQPNTKLLTGGLQRASCVVRGDGDAANVPQAMLEAAAVVTSSRLVGEAMRSSLGLEGDAWTTVAQVEVLPAGERAIRLAVNVRPRADLPLPPDAADRALEALVRELQATFVAKDDRATKDLEAMRERGAAIDQQIAAARAALLVPAEDANATAARLRDRQATLRQVRATAEAEVAEQKADLKAIEAELAALPPGDGPDRRTLDGYRLNTRVAIRRAEQELAKIDAQFAERPDGDAATRPARTVEERRRELNELLTQRAAMERQLAERAGDRPGGIGGVRLRVLGKDASP